MLHIYSYRLHLYLLFLLYTYIVVQSGLSCLMDNLKDMYKIIRCQPEENEWPPNQPKTIVNVALMHHEGEQTQQELIDMSVHRKEGAHAIDKLRVTKSIVDIFATISKSVLIEGAPGIGKTVLTKEISYYWANNKILVDMILFLLVIRDPPLHTVNSVSKLLHYLNNDYLSDNDVECAANELRRSRGTKVVFVLDGYDECPPNSPLKQFIDKLIRGFYLPNCLVVITSRPTASMLLRQIVSRRIEILGFASKEKDEYISESLNNSAQKIEELEKYLKQHPVINSLLYVPLHLAVLLYLFKEGNLPETLTEINEFFIVHTIYRHLVKQKQYLFSKFSKLMDLPQSILRFVYQLSELAFKGLRNSQLVFTYNEIEAVCPDVQHMPEIINGFGLLQAVRHYSTMGIGAGSDLSLNFLHFTMQEYLAALYVSNLPSNQRSSLIKKTFWEGQYNFMWMMFVGIAGIKSKRFDEIFNSIEQFDPAGRSKHYLHLFQCCLEEKNSDIIPPAITSIFSDGHINLRGLTLLPHHVVSLTYFMMRSATKWKTLNLNLCNIGNNGMSILFKHSMDCKEIFTAIKSISLSFNHLTSMLGTNIKSDEQSGNHTATDLSSSGLLLVTSLGLSHNRLSDEGLKELMFALKYNSTLSALNVSDNMVSDESLAAICDCLKSNITLQELNLSKNWISKEGVMRIVVACTKNRTLHKLVCTHNNFSKSGLAVINEYIRKENVVEIFEGSWNSISSKDDCLAIQTTLLTSGKDGEKIIASDNISKELWLINQITDIKYRNDFVKCCINENEVMLAHIPKQCFGVNMFYIMMEILGIDKTLGKLTVLSVIGETATLTTLNVSQTGITDDDMIAISNYLTQNKTLQELNISKNWISKEGVMGIVVACTKNRTLHKLVCTHNNLSKSGLAVINEYIRKENAVEIFEGSWNSISSKDNCLAINTTFHLLVMSSTRSAVSIKSYYIGERLWYLHEITDMKYKKKFIECCIKESDSIHICRTSDGIDVLRGVAEDLGINKLLPKFDISGSNMFIEGIVISSLKINSTLIELNISNCGITKQGVTWIAEALQINETLQKLDVSLNQLCNEDAVAIGDYLENNKTLRELNVSKNWISKEGVMRIVVACTKNRTLHKLVCTHNNLSKSGLAVINEYIRKENAVEIFEGSWNSISSKDNCLAINTTFHLLVMSSTRSAVSIKSYYIGERLWYLHEITDMKYKKKFIECCIKESDSIHICRTSDGIDVLRGVAEDLGINKLLPRFDISGSNMFIEGIVISSLKINSTLIELNISNCGITKQGVTWIAEALQINETLQKLDVSLNQLCNEDAVAISDYLENNKTLRELNVSKNWISKEGVMRIVVACTKNRTLHKLVCTHNNLSKSGLAVINEYIRKENAVKIFKGSWNSISNMDDCLAIQTKLLMSGKDGEKVIASDNISEELWLVNQIIDIECRNDFVKCCINENEVMLAHIPKQCFGVNMFYIMTEFLGIDKTLGKLNVLPVIEETATLTNLNISQTGITDDDTIAISNYLTQNKTIQKLYISKNWISKVGVMRIVVACAKNRTLHKLMCTHNNLSKSGLAVINAYIRKENAVEIFNGSWNSISSKNDCLAINTTFHLLDMSSTRSAVSIKSDYIGEELWYLSEITDMNYRKKFIECCIKESDSIHICRTSDGIDVLRGVVEDLEINKLLPKVDISGSNMFFEGTVISCLRINSTLIELNISNCGITKQGVTWIAEALQINETLQKLDVSLNQLCNEDAVAISDYLENNKTLQELNVSKNWISKEGVMMIVVACTKNRTLPKLVCTHNNLSKSGLAVINEYIRKENAVEIFEGSWNSISSKDGWLAINTTFHLLDMSSTRSAVSIKSDYIGKELWYLKEITHMKYRKKFIECCIKESDSIRICRTHDWIDVLHGVIEDLGIKLLPKVDSSGSIMVIKAIVISCLKINSTLIELDISNCGITKQGVTWIAEALQINETLQKLDVSLNQLCNEDAVAISDYLENNKTLQELNVSKNWINKEGVMRIVVACTKNRTLHKLVCTHNNLSKSGLAVINEYIRKENAVDIFEGSWNSISSKDGWLAINTTFHLLDMSSTRSAVSIKSDYIGKELWYLREITHMKYRKKFIECCIKESDSIRICRTHDWIDVLHGVIEDLGIKLLPKVDSSGSIMFIKAIVISCLKINSTLIELDISNCGITKQGVTWIAEALQINETLQKLDVSLNQLCNEGAVAISDYLENNKTLRELNVSKNWISKEGVMRIVVVCTKNRTLHKLVCTHNNLSKSGLAVINEYIRKENAVEIFEGSWNSISSMDDWLAINTTLHLLDMSSTRSAVSIKSDYIGEELWYLGEITHMKYKKKFIECCIKESDSIRICRTRDGIDVLRGVIEDLGINKLLPKVDISGNNISIDEIVSSCLKINNTLIELNISNCGITKQGVTWIAEALQINETLQKLDVSLNQLCNEDAVAIRDSLENNKTLRELNVSKNWINKEGVMRIVVACTKNRTLHKLVCTHNNLSKSGLAVINEYIRKENAVEIFKGSWNSISSKDGCLAIITTMHLLDVSSENSEVTKSDKIQKELWYVNEITDTKYRTEFVECCIKEDCWIKFIYFFYLFIYNPFQHGYNYKQIQ